ncbi:SAP domain-containing ribonucleoprotein isoform X3 [Rissa tridactyla]|uniref:SAP domain-containing ribonucleoprotein isoform X3 n=1 Tax=Rissa tridactyla TaxID=75485 RepID=UPI0023BAC32D|nr:SAP domain-containing ribonucleoprotein isoform X3 [Rissa tridactyla]
MAAEAVELHKLKLAELKQECLARGLEAKGNKQDLINRLQAYLEEHAEEEANEEDVLGEEIEEEEQKPVEPPVKAEEPPDYGKEGSENNIRNIADGANAEEGRALQRARQPGEQEGGAGSSVNMDKLKERAQRFGLNVSSLSKKSEEDEKLKKRKERFGIVTSSAGAGATEDTEAKKRKRAERFGIV